jgi:two-component system, NarL family, response regulator DegU
MNNILILDDNDLFRYSIKSLFNNLNEIIVIEARDIIEAEILMAKNSIQLVLLDIQLKETSGIDFAKFLNEHYSNVKILYLSVFDIKGKLAEIVETTHSGIIYKDVSVQLFENIIKLILAGGRYIDEKLVAEVEFIKNRGHMSRNVKISSNQKKFFDSDKNIFLTNCELEVSLKIAEGKSSKQIGEELKKSQRTVDVHKRNVFVKLGFNKNTQLTQYVIAKIIPLLN